MATLTLAAAMPALELTEGETMVLEAINPTTGAAVGGVVATNFVIYATSSENDDPSELTLADVYLTPTSGDLIRPDPIPGRGDQPLKATALFVDGPCRLQKRVLTFNVQPPEDITCGGTTYTISANQGLRFLNYVVKHGENDAGYQGVRGQRDVFHAWSQIHHALNRTVPHKVTRIRHAGRRIRRAVR